MVRPVHKLTTIHIGSLRIIMRNCTLILVSDMRQEMRADRNRNSSVHTLDTALSSQWHRNSSSHSIASSFRSCWIILSLSLSLCLLEAIRSSANLTAKVVFCVPKYSHIKTRNASHVGSGRPLCEGCTLCFSWPSDYQNSLWRCLSSNHAGLHHSRQVIDQQWGYFRGLECQQI